MPRKCTATIRAGFGNTRTRPPRTQARRGLSGHVAIALHTGTICIRLHTQNHMEARIKESLIALMDGIRRADGQVIEARMAALDECLSEGRGTLHPQLIHFLERRSYPKALMFLGGESDIPVGSCGGRP